MESNERKPRTVTLHLQNEDYVRITMAPPANNNDEFNTLPWPDHNALYQALGYLSSWNLNYLQVDIYTDGTADLVAVYKNEDDIWGYTIGAIWDASSGRYGFHS